MTAFLQRAGGVCAALACLAGLLAAGCASPPPADPADGPCAACVFAFEQCLPKDDYGPCMEMRRFCAGWCEKAQTCKEGCEGASWGCEAASTRRDTCDRLAGSCPAWCDGETPP